MALFAGLESEAGAAAWRRGARAGATSGECPLRQKVNAWRRGQPPENAGLGRPTPSGVANKPLNRAVHGLKRSPARPPPGRLRRGRVLGLGEGERGALRERGEPGGDGWIACLPIALRVAEIDVAKRAAKPQMG